MPTEYQIIFAFTQNNTLPTTTTTTTAMHYDNDNNNDNSNNNSETKECAALWSDTPLQFYHRQRRNIIIDYYNILCRQKNQEHYRTIITINTIN